MDKLIDFADVNRIADTVQAQIHIFDLNGLKPDFSYHSARQACPHHIFLLQDNDHFHFISNIQEFY